MTKFCFFECEHEGKKIIGCAYEVDGKASYLGMDLDKWENLSSTDKIEKLNEMMLALIKHTEDKDNIEFKDYQRQ